MQTEEKRDLQYKSLRELVWGIGLLIMSNQGDFDWISGLLGVTGVLSLIMTIRYEVKLRQ